MFYAVTYCKIHGEDKAKIQSNYQKIAAAGFLPLLKDSFWALLSPVYNPGRNLCRHCYSYRSRCCIGCSICASLSACLSTKQSPSKSSLNYCGFPAVKSAAPICFLLAFATAFGRTLSLIHAADIVQNAIMTIATDKISFLIVVIIAFFLLGMVMDTGPALIILGPILCPIAESYGI